MYTQWFEIVSFASEQNWAKKKDERAAGWGGGLGTGLGWACGLEVGWPRGWAVLGVWAGVAGLGAGMGEIEVLGLKA